jgi:hypothetical protein
MPETIDHMIVHHPHGLHKGVADRAAHEREASPFQVLAHGVRFRGLGRGFLVLGSALATERAVVAQSVRIKKLEDRLASLEENAEEEQATEADQPRE